MCCSIISNTGICGLLLNIDQTAALQDRLSICCIFNDFTSIISKVLFIKFLCKKLTHAQLSST